MKKMTFGAMMAGLLGLGGVNAVTAQVVAEDGWWRSEYQVVQAADRGRVGGRGLPADRGGEYRGDRDDGYYDDGYYDDGRPGAGRGTNRDGYDDGVTVDVYRERDGRPGQRGRVIRADGRVGIRLPGRVVVTARPSLRYRGRRASALYWSEVNWNVRFRERYVGHGYRARLQDIVGKKTVKQLQRHRNRLHVRGALTYRWVSLGRRGMMLQVRAGRIPIAELIDFHNDRYVDIVRLNQSAW